MKYKFIPHTADAKFQAFGKDLGEAFANAAIAMTSVMVDVKKIEANIKKKISIESESKEALLYDFLEQFLILLDSNQFILKEVKKIKITQTRNSGLRDRKIMGDVSKSNFSITKGKTYKLEAEAVGDKFSNKYETMTLVKAVTYNDMFIKEEKEKVTVQVVIDV